MDEFDGPWKEALEWFFPAFLAFFFPDIHDHIDWTHDPEFLDKELQRLAPEAETGRGTVDKLVRVRLRNGADAWLFIHVEIQSQPEAEFAARMYRYNHRLADRFGVMPVSLAVLGDDRPGWRPTRFSDERFGCAVEFRFPVAKVLDYSGREADLETEPNPFAAVVLGHLKTITTRDDPDARRAWKFRLVKSLYDRGFDRQRVVQLFRLIDWMMTLPRDVQRAFLRDVDKYEEERTMPFITPTEQMWLDDGRLRGLYEGVEAVLDLRFGTAGVDLMPRVRRVTEAEALAQILTQIRRADDLAGVEQLLPPANS